jgi:hypothetical protein
MTFLLSALLISVCFFEGCKPPVEIEKTSLITRINMNGEDTLYTNADYSTRIKGQAREGMYSFRADSLHEYAAGVKIVLHDSVLNSAIRVVLNFWIKSNIQPLKGDGMAVSFFNQKEELTSWASFDLIKYSIKADEWVNVIDSVTIPAEKIDQSGMFFKIFAYNPNKKADIDVDEVNITLKKVYKVME